ncbi:transcriptional regulator opi1, partial [Linderina pennispora]
SLQDAARILLGGQAGQEVARVGDPPQATSNVREAAVKLAQRRREIVVTVKRAVGIISQYAGSVLPGEARRQVRGLILSLPGRWMTVDTAVSATSSVGSDESPSVRPMDTSGNIEANARRTLAFATESFYMLDSVRNVFQNLYANAERWVGAPAEQPETVPLVEARERPVPVRRPPKKLPPGLAMTPAEEPSGKRLSTQSLVEIGEQMRRMDMSQSRAGPMDIDDAVPLASPRLSAMRTTYDEAVANKRNRTREPSPTR